MKLIDKAALVAEIEARIKGIEVSQKAGMIKKRDADKKILLFKSVLSLIDTLEVKELQEEPVSEDLIDATNNYCVNVRKGYPRVMDETDRYICNAFKAGANWQEKQDQSTIELAEDHAYFAGRTKTIDEIKEALLSLVLPCFMHGGEADEVVAKLDEVLNQKK